MSTDFILAYLLIVVVGVVSAIIGFRLGHSHGSSQKPKREDVPDSA